MVILVWLVEGYSIWEGKLTYFTVSEMKKLCQLFVSEHEMHESIYLW